MENSLYNQDFTLWTQKQVILIQGRQLDQIDWENIQEEIAALGRLEKQELANLLEVLLEHLLKRCYINSTYNNRGWELTIKEQRRQIRRLIKASPSLKEYLQEILPEIWAEALSDVQDSYYQGVSFPENYPFSEDLESLLSTRFWHKTLQYCS